MKKKYLMFLGALSILTLASCTIDIEIGGFKFSNKKKSNPTVTTTVVDTTTNTTTIPQTTTAVSTSTIADVTSTDTTVSTSTIIDDTPELTIYSIEMHDKYGDSFFIQYGDYDVLIDAGDQGDGSFVNDFVKSHISEDNVLDLLVVTHCHSDHMGGLVKMTKSDNSVKALDGISKVNNIIDFGHDRTGNTMYDNWVILRNTLIENGSNWITAYEATHGGTSTLSFGDLTVDIIDTNNYVKVGEVAPTTEYNDFSVATLFTYGNVKLFCAGDLEDDGEANLVANAPNTKLNDITEDNNVIYKMCHHGTDVGSANSKTSGAASKNGGNRFALLNILKPDYVVVSSRIGESAHPFARAVATSKYFTDNIYFNGTNGTLEINIVNDNISITGHGATTAYKIPDNELIEIDYEAEKNLVFTDTTWYKNSTLVGSITWYKGGVETPTIEQVTDWYYNELLTMYPKA